MLSERVSTLTLKYWRLEGSSQAEFRPTPHFNCPYTHDSGKCLLRAFENPSRTVVIRGPEAQIKTPPSQWLRSLELRGHANMSPGGATLTAPHSSIIYAHLNSCLLSPQEIQARVHLSFHFPHINNLIKSYSSFSTISGSYKYRTLQATFFHPRSINHSAFSATNIHKFSWFAFIL